MRARTKSNIKIVTPSFACSVVPNANERVTEKTAEKIATMTMIVVTYKTGLQLWLSLFEDTMPPSCPPSNAVNASNGFENLGIASPVTRAANRAMAGDFPTIRPPPVASAGVIWPFNIVSPELGVVTSLVPESWF